MPKPARAAIMPNSRDEWFTIGLEHCVGMWLQSYFTEMPLGFTHAQRKALDDYVERSCKEAIDLDVEFPGWLPETVSEARLAELIAERAERGASSTFTYDMALLVHQCYGSSFPLWSLCFKLSDPRCSFSNKLSQTCFANRFR